MDAVGVLLIGTGAWLMFEAWRNTNPTPITNAQRVLTSATSSTTTPTTIPNPTTLLYGNG